MLEIIDDTAGHAALSGMRHFPLTIGPAPPPSRAQDEAARRPGADAETDSAAHRDNHSLGETDNGGVGGIRLATTNERCRCRAAHNTAQTQDNTAPMQPQRGVRCSAARHTGQ